jgi:2-succinyl-5-enolpyruvyl-6-hydroxy-3-cyclohexene-1-carboxylate synthase
LLLITADRPPELHDTGANQTISQAQLFSTMVAWHFNLPVPDDRIELTFVFTTIDQAVHRARSTSGPVHLNCMFAEPLMSGSARSNWRDPRAVDRPYTTYSMPSSEPSEQIVEEVASSIVGATNGVIVVGPLQAATNRSAISSLSDNLGWPILADIQSGVRFAWANHQLPSTVRHYDLVLDCVETKKNSTLFTPDVVLHLGGRLTSKAYLRQLSTQPPAACIHVAEHPRRIDPAHTVTSRIQAAPDHFCSALDNALHNIVGSGSYRFNGTRATTLVDAGQAVAQAVTAVLGTETDANEPALAADLIELLPPEWRVFSGSSMPIRDLDTFAQSANRRPEPLTVGSNRGASGIDGAISSAIGYACGANAPIAALVGDLSVLHDLGSLSMIAQSPQPIVIVVANNNGGGIFNFLPTLTDQRDVFEHYFATPHGHRFEHACRMFNLDYYQPVTRSESREVLKQCFFDERSAVIEITTDREQNLSLHQRLRENACTAIDTCTRVEG